MSRSFAAALVVFVSGCSGCGDAPAPLGAASAAPVGLEVGTGKKTTSATIATNNLNAKVTNSEKLVASGRDPVGSRAHLIGSLLERVDKLGKVSDLDRVVQLEADLAKMPPTDSVLMARVSALSAAHQFGAALAQLDEVDKMLLRPSGLRMTRASILLATGRYEEACQLFAAERVEWSNHVSLSMEAICISHLGRIEEADRLFADAEYAYRDNSPFMLGWIWFERGSMWERAGDVDKAKSLYRATLDRLPTYAHAAGHLAQLVPASEAEAILAPVLAVSDDPEYKAVLGLAKEELAPGSGRAHLDEAKRGYDALMEKHPLAFADHAGWFYLEAAKDPAKAAEVATRNLTNRRTHEAYELALAALMGAGQTARACEIADEAAKLKHRPPRLEALSAKVYAGCGKPPTVPAAPPSAPAAQSPSPG